MDGTEQHVHLKDKTAELVVAVRSLRFPRGPQDDGFVALKGKTGYVKFEAMEFTRKSGVFKIDGLCTSVDDVCHVPLAKAAMPPDAVLTMRIKTVASNATIRLTPARGKSTVGIVSVRIRDVANLGSPDNFGLYAVHRPDDPTDVLLEMEMAMFWCQSSDLPTASSPSSRKNLREKLMRKSFPRYYTAQTDFENAVGADGFKREPGWVDTVSESGDWNEYSKLTVRVLEATGLRAADSNGLSDPYCLVSCRGTRFKTHTVRRTLTPCWDEEFRFSSVEGIETEDEVTITVRDHDRLSRDDDLGQVVVPIWALMRDQVARPTWFELSATDRMKWDRSKSLGWIFLHLQFRPRRTLQRQSSSVSLDLAMLSSGRLPHISPMSPSSEVVSPGDERRGSAEDQAECASLASPLTPGSGMASPLSPRRLPSTISSVSSMRSPVPQLSNKSLRPRLFVRVMQARHLQSADANGFSDPYCVVSCKRQTHRTRVIRKSLDPKWNQLFQFGDKDYINETDVVVVTLFDKDFGLLEGVADDKLGTVEIPVFQLKDQDPSRGTREPTWFPLISDKYACAGEVQLSCLYMPPQNYLDSERARDLYKGKEWLYELQVTLLSGRGLTATDTKRQTSDPYCVLRVGNAKRTKSKVMKRTLNPIWNQSFKFRKSVDVGREGLGRMDHVEIQVMGEETRGMDVPLGVVEFDMGVLLDRIGYVDKMGAEITDYFPLMELTGASLDDEDDVPEGAETSALAALSASFKNRARALSRDADRDSAAEAETDDRSHHSHDNVGSGRDRSARSPQSRSGRFFSRRGVGLLRGSRQSSASTDVAGMEEEAKNGRTETSEDTVNRFKKLTSIDVKGMYDSTKGHALAMSERIGMEVSTTRKGSLDGEESLSIDGNGALHSDRDRGASDSGAESLEVVPRLKRKNTTATNLEDLEPHGSIRLKLRVVPIGELRMHEKTKLCVDVQKLADVCPRVRTASDRDAQSLSMRDPRVPSMVFAKLRLGHESAQSSLVRFHPHFGGVSVFNTHFVFDNWASVQEAAKAQKKDALVSTEAKGLELTIHDAGSDHVLARRSWTVEEIREQVTRNSTEGGAISHWSESKPQLFLGSTPIVQLAMREVAVHEELRPVLGHFHLKLLRLKLRRDDFDRTFRTVVRYNNHAVTTRGESGNMSIDFPHVMPVSFPVYEMFAPVVIEVWWTSRGNQQTDDDGARTSKWGKLFGSVTISMFDMLELEAQIVYAETGLTNPAVLPRLKLPVMSKSGKMRGSIWVEAIFDENISEVVKPNPNPKRRPPKPFSLANVRHEISRTSEIVGWLGMVGGSMGYLLDWQDKALTVFALAMTILFCGVDFYSERILVIPVYLLLAYMMRKHHQRMNGQFVHNMMKDARAKETNARLRIAVVRARGLVSKLPGKTSRFGSITDSLQGVATTGADLLRDALHDPDDDVEDTPDVQRLPSGNNVSRAIGRLNLRKKLLMRRSRSEERKRTTSRLRRKGQSHEGGPALPCARAVVSLRPTIGSNTSALRIGSTRRSAPTRAPDFFNTKQGYAVAKSSKGNLKSQLIDWECVNAAGVNLPAFQADLKQVPVNQQLLMVRIYGARNLAACDATGFSDPYVLVRVLSSGKGGSATGNSMANTVRTRVVPKSINPTWNQEFVLGHDYPIQGEDTVLLQLCDSDGVGATDDDMGYVSLSVSDVNSIFVTGKGLVNPVWLRVTPPSSMKAPQTSSSKLGALGLRALTSNHAQANGAPDPQDGEPSSLDAGEILISMRAINFSDTSTGQVLCNTFNDVYQNGSGSGASSRSSSSNDTNTGPAEAAKAQSSHDVAANADTDTGSRTERGRAASASSSAGEQPAQTFTPSPDSWYRCGSEIVIEVEDASMDRERGFLGCARIPVAALIQDEERLTQPVFEEWVALDPRMDGGNADKYLFSRFRTARKLDLGEVFVRVELVLPDPKAKERLIELEEAKRADRASRIAKIRMINQRLADFQNALYQFNNKMENIKNLFNWAHPRKTKLIFRLVSFLAIMFTIVPSRYIVMFVALFMFTERFRRMGTMGLRFNHMLAMLPTDDDLRDACAGGILSAKRKSRDEMNEALTEDVLSAVPHRTVCEDSLGSPSGATLPPLLVATELEEGPVCNLLDAEKAAAAHVILGKFARGSRVHITAEDIEQGFCSTLRLLHQVTNKLSYASGKPRWTSRYFFLSREQSAVAWWTSRESFESLTSPLGLVANIVGIETSIPHEHLHGCERPELCFGLLCSKNSPTSLLASGSTLFKRSTSGRSHRSVSTDDEPPMAFEKIYLMANSLHKKHRWIAAIWAMIGQPPPPPITTSP
ncbi:Multiple C2 and transmembrane domain-containing protein 1 [Durusdinium trenchii]|uniref:Multiple C2 and transmembrane domain-containing protein 1 n=1 Tax=Durusdinium trenchii TaxID=1381693 RepID=A0ABP0IGN1_9DINO